jgi:hypothetical protein
MLVRTYNPDSCWGVKQLSPLPIPFDTYEANVQLQIFPVDHALSPYLGALEVHLPLTMLLNATE